MEILGYKLTYVRACFWCSDKVFAHTNGKGDFVLLDKLGAPWKVHPCWENRPKLPASRLNDEIHRELDRLKAQLRTLELNLEFDRLKKRLGIVGFQEFQGGKHKFPTIIRTVRPEEFLRKGPFKKSGRLQFYCEGRLSHFLGNLGAFDRAEAERIFANRNSELGIADAQGNLFICFADMRKVVISPEEFVEVQLSACRVPIPKLSPVFLCHLVERRPRPTHRRWDKD